VKYLRRLIQPRKAAFWLMLVLNGLSTALVWMVQTFTLTPAAAALIAMFALGNTALGLYFMRALLRPPKDFEPSNPPGA
jgi:hypothetical protein